MISEWILPTKLGLKCEHLEDVQRFYQVNDSRNVVRMVVLCQTSYKYSFYLFI